MTKIECAKKNATRATGAIKWGASLSSVVLAASAAACTAAVGDERNEPVHAGVESQVSPSKYIAGPCIVTTPQATKEVMVVPLDTYVSPLSDDEPYGIGATSPAGYQTLNCLSEYVVQLNVPATLFEAGGAAPYATGGLFITSLAKWPAGAQCSEKHIDFTLFGETASGEWTLLANDSAGCNPADEYDYDSYLIGGANAQSLTQYRSFLVQTSAYLQSADGTTYEPVYVSAALGAGGD